MSEGDIKAIVKVQRPLNDPSGPWLVYDQTRMHRELIEKPPEALVRALGSDPKGYFAALWKGDRWVIGERVKDRAW